VLPKPCFNFREPHSTCLVKVHKKSERLPIVEFEAIAIHLQECGGNRNGGSFISIYEGVVLRETFP
jgi:hypothetical protein